MATTRRRDGPHCVVLAPDAGDILHQILHLLGPLDSGSRDMFRAAVPGQAFVTKSSTMPQMTAGFEPVGLGPDRADRPGARSTHGKDPGAESTICEQHVPVVERHAIGFPIGVRPHVTIADRAAAASLKLQGICRPDPDAGQTCPRIWSELHPRGPSPVVRGMRELASTPAASTPARGSAGWEAPMMSSQEDKGACSMGVPRSDETWINLRGVAGYG